MRAGGSARSKWNKMGCIKFKVLNNTQPLMHAKPRTDVRYVHVQKKKKWLVIFLLHFPRDPLPLTLII